MAYEVIHTAPQTSDFTALSDHQDHTPGTFFGGKPVLHLHCTNAKLQMTQLELANNSDFAALSDCSNGWKEAAEITGMEFWITSRYRKINQASMSLRVALMLLQVLDSVVQHQVNRHPDPLPDDLPPRRRRRRSASTADPFRPQHDSGRGPPGYHATSCTSYCRTQRRHPPANST